MPSGVDRSIAERSSFVFDVKVRNDGSTSKDTAVVRAEYKPGLVN